MEILKFGIKSKSVGLIQRALGLYIDNIFGRLTEEAVKEFQRNNGLIPDGIVGQRTWEAINRAAIKTNRNIDEIIVHCTATPDGKDFTVDDIRRWHKAKGWADIGYHYVVYRDGSIHAGRPESIAGAHCKGHNTRSIGVVYIGGLKYIPDTPTAQLPPKDTRTLAQRVSMLNLLKRLKVKYPNAKIYGHCDFDNKACPSFDAKTEYKDL